MELAYLFECHFVDGTMIQQTPDDISKLDSARSAFYDVSQRIDEVIVFGLVNDDHTYVVDLRDGHFEIDGVPFDISGQDELPAGTSYRLIYFRRVVHTITQGFVNMTDSTVKYHIGWQATVDGKNFQQTISVS
jgi:hypothetical protein